MRCGGACLAPVLLGCWLQAEATSWTDFSDDCLSTISRDEKPAESLAAACPALTRALADDPWSELLATPAEALSPWAVIDLSAMAERYRRPARGPRPAGATLDDVLDGLPAETEEAPPSLWERFLEWLRGRFDDAGGGLPGWLADASIPRGVMQWIWYAGILVIVLLAAAVAANELRHRNRRRAADAMAGAGGSGAASPAAGDTPVGTPGEQLTALFRLVVARLEAAGAIPRRPSLTHRQVATSRTLPAPQRQIVSSLGTAAERATYGYWEPGPRDVEPHLEAGRRLLNDLAGGPP